MWMAGKSFADAQMYTLTDANTHSTFFTYDAFGRVTNTNFPSSQSEYYYYYANNNLTSKTDRKGQTITYVYDALNRLTRKQRVTATILWAIASLHWGSRRTRITMRMSLPPRLG